MNKLCQQDILIFCYTQFDKVDWIKGQTLPKRAGKEKSRFIA